LNLNNTIRDQFDRLFPFSLISNVILYRNDRGEFNLFANEIDHLFHYKKNGKDHLVIIEVKNRNLYGNAPNQQAASNSPWKIKYDEKEKNIKWQVRDQAIALKQFCHNVSRIRPEIECWVVDRRENVQHIIQDEKDRNLYLLTLTGFGHKLAQVEAAVRLEHSEFLRELRRGIIATDLGHPEIINAVKFIKNCRKSLDDQIYRFFQPRLSCYAINGCAGMGKSVLLAYSIFVFASDYAVYFDNDKPILNPFKEDSKLPSFNKRKIYAYAVKTKQIKALEFYYQQISEQIMRMTSDSIALQQPIFRLWKGNIPKDCTILVIDESHDLSIDDQHTIANWIKRDDDTSIRRYLLVACDRNQALKRKESDEDIIAGINFSGHTTRLNRIYRCPFPVYVASIGLLFRWFAPQGGNVVLSTQRLREHFGFKPYVKELDDGMLLSMRNDCHPGNNWKQTVNYFPTCSMAYDHLSQFSFNRDDVLWACFKKTDSEFDYTKIQRDYIYVDLKDADATNEIDKNIKGQEFSIVVVEGLPADMNPQELLNNDDWGPDLSDVERRMWRVRKNIYIVCSRASGFLYFVIDLNETDDKNSGEISNLIKQVSKPIKGKNESGQTWEFKVNKPTTKRKPVLFKEVDDLVSVPEEKGPSTNDLHIVEYDGILSVPELAAAYGILQEEFQASLPNDAKAKYNIDIVVLPDHAKLVAKKHGIKLKRVKKFSSLTDNQQKDTHDNKIIPYDYSKTKKRREAKEIRSYSTTLTERNRKKFVENKLHPRPHQLPFTGDCANKKVYRINLFDKTHYISTWQELLLTVAEKVYQLHSNEFQKCLILQGNKRKYYSTNRKDLVVPKQISNSKYFIETHYNANSIVRRCRELMSLFGHSDKHLDIFVE